MFDAWEERPVAAGVLEPALLDAVTGLHKDRKAYRKRLHSRRTARHLIERERPRPRSRAAAGPVTGNEATARTRGVYRPSHA